MMAPKDDQTDFCTRRHLKKKRVIIITACILGFAGVLVFVLSLVFGVGDYKTNDEVENHVFKLAFWAGMPAMAVATFGVITWAQRKIWMGNVHVGLSLLIVVIGVYLAYYVSVLDMQVGYEKAPGLVIFLEVSFIIYTVASFIAFMASYATVFIIQEIQENEMYMTSLGTGTPLDKQLQNENDTLQLTGEDIADTTDQPDEEELSHEEKSESEN